MFQVLYKNFKHRLKFVQSAFMHKEFFMQKNKVKAFICCCFAILSKKNECGINENLAQLKLFPFKHISNLAEHCVFLGRNKCDNDQTLHDGSTH